MLLVCFGFIHGFPSLQLSWHTSQGLKEELIEKRNQLKEGYKRRCLLVPIGQPKRGQCFTAEHMALAGFSSWL